MILSKRNRDGRMIPQTYYTKDFKYEVEKGTVGWNVNIFRKYVWGTTYEYSFSCDTLAEVRESLTWIYANT